MRVNPIEPYIYMGSRLPQKRHPEDDGNILKRPNPLFHQPSFKHVLNSMTMSTDTPKGQGQPTFTGHWPQYNKKGDIYDVGGMLFPMTCIPTDKPTPGQLNYLA